MARITSCKFSALHTILYDVHYLVSMSGGTRSVLFQILWEITICVGLIMYRISCRLQFASVH